MLRVAWVLLALVGCSPGPQPPEPTLEQSDLPLCLYLELDPTELDFGDVESSGLHFGERRQVAVLNHSQVAKAVKLGTLDLPFSVGVPDLQVPRGASRTLLVSFRPVDSRSTQTELELSTGDCVARLPLRGRGAGEFSLSSFALDFGVVPLGQPKTLELHLTNSRHAPVLVSHLHVTQANGIFTIDSPADFEVPPGVTVIRVSALATVARSYFASLTARDSVGAFNFDVGLRLEAR